jgi:hypothetical protein
MIEIYKLVTKISSLTQTTKIYVVSGTIVVSCIVGLVSKCSENADLRARLAHMENLRQIDSGIQEIKDLSGKIKPPTIEEIEIKNEAVNSSDRDNTSDTF